MATTKILIAGFGGQGVLFTGKVIAFTGLTEEKEVAWLPSYGPEMRGGTANCSITVSDEPIGSPIVSEPDLLITMNKPSFEKYRNDVVKGGIVVLDSSLIDNDLASDKIEYYPIPATKMASDNGLEGLVNMIMLGKAIKASALFDFDVVLKAMEKLVSTKKPELLEKNIKAIELGYNY